MCISPLAMLSPGAALLKKTGGLGAVSPALAIAGALTKKKKSTATSTTGAMTNTQGAY